MWDGSNNGWNKHAFQPHRCWNERRRRGDYSAINLKLAKDLRSSISEANIRKGRYALKDLKK